MPLCCTDCFNDTAIKQKIKDLGNIGYCSYCGGERVACVSPDKISDSFEFFSYCIEKNENASESYANLIQEKFHLFNNNIRNLNDLITDILGREYSTPTFKFKHDYNKHLELWTDFKDELKYRNRFFPNNSLYSTIFNYSKGSDAIFLELLGQLTRPLYAGRRELFRARISDKRLEAKDLHMPPPGSASGGRANPVGISYLYLAENIKTCIAEVRPSNSSSIWISSFELNKDLNVLDLTSPKKSVTVTSFEGDCVEEIINYVNLLENLSTELSKPILPDKSSIDYLPTQFICEFIKSVGKYDGIIFKSSFGEGNNFVFYSQEHFTITQPELFSVTRTTHEFSKQQLE